MRSIVFAVLILGAFAQTCQHPSGDPANCGRGLASSCDDDIATKNPTQHPFKCGQCFNPGETCECLDSGTACASCSNDWLCVGDNTVCASGLQSADCFTCPSNGCCNQLDRLTQCSGVNNVLNSNFCDANAVCVPCEDDVSPQLNTELDTGCSAELPFCVIDGAPDSGVCKECEVDSHCNGSCGKCMEGVCVPNNDACGCGRCFRADDVGGLSFHKCETGSNPSEGFCTTCQCPDDGPCVLAQNSCSADNGRPLGCQCSDVSECCGAGQGKDVACVNGRCFACGCLVPEPGTTSCALSCDGPFLGRCEFCGANPPGNNCRPKDSKRCGQFCGGNEESAGDLCELFGDCAGLDLPVSEELCGGGGGAETSAAQVGLVSGAAVLAFVATGYFAMKRMRGRAARQAQAQVGVEDAEQDAQENSVEADGEAQINDAPVSDQ